MATQYHEFDTKAVDEALSAANEHNEGFAVTAADSSMTLAGCGEFEVRAQCLSLVIQNHRVCLRLPLGIGNICLPIPVGIPNGTAAQACLSICTTWGFPTGLRVSVSVAGHTVIRKTFGRC